MAKTPSKNRALSAAPRPGPAGAADKAAVLADAKAQEKAAKTPAPGAPAVHGTAKAAKYVIVASKLPFNLEIQLCRPQESRVTGQFGSVNETVHVKFGEVLLICGTSYPVNNVPKGFPKPPGMIEDEMGGYAMTVGMPADFMREWMKQNADTDMVKNGMIKVHAELESLESDAREHAGISSGLGPLNPDGDRRAPKPQSTAVLPVSAEKREAA